MVAHIVKDIMTTGNPYKSVFTAVVKEIGYQNIFPWMNLNVGVFTYLGLS